MFFATKKHRNSRCFFIVLFYCAKGQICVIIAFAKYFTMICGASTDFSRNSKEAVIAHLLEECGTQEHAVMVGDTAYDVVGARVHNIPCIGVSWGYGTVADMEQAGAVSIARTVSQLYDQLK